MAANRLFFALWPTDEVRKACADAARLLNMRQPHGGHATPASRHHLTLFFVDDEVPAVAEAAILRAAAELAAPPFTLTLDQASGFGSVSTTWWLGARQRSNELAALQKQLRERVLRVYRPVRRWQFSPHLTIARDARCALPPTPITPIVWPVSEFVLIRSYLQEQPLRYEVLGRWPLDPRASIAPPERPQLELGF